MNQFTFRMSTEDDLDQIVKLIDKRFGDRNDAGVTENLNNRYLLAFDRDKLIAMTGVSDSGAYNGLEVDWTCVLKEYSGHGLVVKMLRMLLKNCRQDVYCSCWRLGNRPYPNLDRVMKELGFIEVIRGWKHFNCMYNKCRDICVGTCDYLGCYEDLYLLKYKDGK